MGFNNMSSARSKNNWNCRICLSSGDILCDLGETAFQEEDSLTTAYSNITIKEAIEKVTSSKVLTAEACPKNICLICLNHLKVSLRFICKFEQSEKELSERLGIPPNPVCSTGSDCVNIIFGKNTYNLNDLVVVEADEEIKSDFKGFLNNLGNEITASFADKVQKQRDIDVENNITVALINKNQILPVTELELIEGTNEIKCIVEDSSEPTEEIRLTVENSDEGENFESDEALKPESPDVDMDSDEEVIEVSLTDAEEYHRSNECMYDEHDSDEVITMRLEDLENQKLGPNEILNLDRFVVVDEGTTEENFELNLNKFVVVDEGNIEGNYKYCLKENINNSPQTCEICGKTFRNRPLLRSHKHRSHSKKEYVCDVCGHKNNTLSAYKNHKNKHIGKQWVCELCMKTYYTKSVLKVHMETHKNQRKYLCNICGKSFNYSNALSYHMRLHTGEKKYQCGTCGQKFRMPNALKRHIRTHTGERPYQCRFCDRTFSSSGEMVTHEMIHTGIRPFTCKYCQKGFIKSHNLKVHMLNHGGPYMCQTCGKSFAEQSILVMHCRISHKQIIQNLSEDNDSDN